MKVVNGQSTQPDMGAYSVHSKLFRQELFEKVLWDVLVSLQKFLSVSRRVLEDEVWMAHLTPEIRDWLRDWYPEIEASVAQLTALMDGEPEICDCNWRELLECVGNTPENLARLLEGARQHKLPDTMDDAMLESLVSHLMRIVPIREDIRDKNYARLWRADYDELFSPKSARQFVTYH